MELSLLTCWTCPLQSGWVQAESLLAVVFDHVKICQRCVANDSHATRTGSSPGSAQGDWRGTYMRSFAPHMDTPQPRCSDATKPGCLVGSVNVCIVRADALGGWKLTRT